MLGESLYRLYVSSNMFYPTCKSIHSFIRCHIKDGDGHTFARDTMRPCRLWWWKATSFLVSSYILSLVFLPFLLPLSSTSSAASSYFSQFCSCNLDWWSESSSLLFKLISIWYVRFFYCYYFAKCFSFVESFEIRSSNIWNDVIRMKCWMKQEVHRSNMKIILDEPKNVGRKTYSQSNFHPTQFFFIQPDFFFFC